MTEHRVSADLQAVRRPANGADREAWVAYANAVEDALYEARVALVEAQKAEIGGEQSSPSAEALRHARVILERCEERGKHPDIERYRDLLEFAERADRSARYHERVAASASRSGEAATPERQDLGDEPKGSSSAEVSQPQATATKVREKAFFYKTNFYELPTRDELVEMLEDCAAALVAAERERDFAQHQEQRHKDEVVQLRGLVLGKDAQAHVRAMLAWDQLVFERDQEQARAVAVEAERDAMMADLVAVSKESARNAERARRGEARAASLQEANDYLATRIDVRAARVVTLEQALRETLEEVRRINLDVLRSNDARPANVTAAILALNELAVTIRRALAATAEAGERDDG